MFRRFDRCMYGAAMLYIALPILIFFSMWLRPVLAVATCAIVLASLFFAIRNPLAETSWRLDRRQTILFVGVILIIAIWVFFSGQGGFAFQNSDYHDRNAIFHDLIEKSWPVTYDFSAASLDTLEGLNALPHFAVLTYYIAFWLPGALVGKLFGWTAGNVALYLWAFIGLVLTAYFLFRTLRRVTIRSILIMIFFSGLDIVGYLWATKGALPSPIAHIEWWSGFQYSSLTTLIFWVFNQAIVFFLALMLIENMKNSRSLFFLYALLLLYGPFPFLGMLPFVLVKAYEGVATSIRKPAIRPIGLFFRSFFEGIVRALSFENIAGGITVLAIVYLYFYGNVAAGRYMGLSRQMNPGYIVFLTFEVLFPLLLAGIVYFRKPYFVVCALSLVAIGFFQVGIGQDFCMRVSIPAIFVLMLFVQKLLLGQDDPRGRMKPVTLVVEGTQQEAASQTLAITEEEDIAERSEEKATQCLVEDLPEESKTNGLLPDSLSPSKTGRKKMILAILTDRDLRLVRVVLCVLLVIGSVVPSQEILRSVWHTIPAYPQGASLMLWIGETLASAENESIAQAGEALILQSGNGNTAADDKKTLENISITTTNFVASTEKNFFFEYLARPTDS